MSIFAVDNNQSTFFKRYALEVTTFPDFFDLAQC